MVVPFPHCWTNWQLNGWFDLYSIDGAVQTGTTDIRLFEKKNQKKKKKTEIIIISCFQWKKPFRGYEYGVKSFNLFVIRFSKYMRITCANEIWKRIMEHGTVTEVDKCDMMCHNHLVECYCDEKYRNVATIKDILVSNGTNSMKCIYETIGEYLFSVRFDTARINELITINRTKRVNQYIYNSRYMLKPFVLLLVIQINHRCRWAGHLV